VLDATRVTTNTGHRNHQNHNREIDVNKLGQSKDNEEPVVSFHENRSGWQLKEVSQRVLTVISWS
jgi:hypothetical protein